MKKSNPFPEHVVFLEEAIDDLKSLDGSVRLQVVKAIIKVAEHPQPGSEGGLGIPLRNDAGASLAGFNEIKLKKPGIRCIYQCIPVSAARGMKIIVISARKDYEVYAEAEKRIEKYKL